MRITMQALGCSLVVVAVLMACASCGKVPEQVAEEASHAPDAGSQMEREREQEQVAEEASRTPDAEPTVEQKQEQVAGEASGLPDAEPKLEQEEAAAPGEAERTSQDQEQVPGEATRAPDAVPKMKVEVRWEFSAGSGGIAPTPHKWTTHLSLVSEDMRRWVVVPDLLFAEAIESIAIAGGLIPNDRRDARNACVPHPVRSAPTDSSGASAELLLFPAGGTRFIFSLGAFVAQLKINGQVALWVPAELAETDRLDCEWQTCMTGTFKDEAKQQEEYHIFHLGPVLYAPAYPDTPSFVLSARSSGQDQKGEWADITHEFVPLTVARVKPEIADASRPLAWRSQFLALLWDNPRPAPGTSDLLMDVVHNAEDYPVVMRISAASGLLAFDHAPAKPILLSVLQNAEEDGNLRKHLAGRIEVIAGERAERVAAEIAKNTDEQKDVREECLKALARIGTPAAWSVVEGLRRDGAVGETARKLVEDREKE